MSQDISQQKDWLSAWKIFYEPEESLEKVDPNAVSISSCLLYTSDAADE